jgi:hypothetical protein
MDQRSKTSVFRRQAAITIVAIVVVDLLAEVTSFLVG